MKQVWGDVYHATRYPAPSGVMFGGGVRYNGIKLMANHGITVAGPAFSEPLLAQVSASFHHAQGLPAGATGRPPAGSGPRRAWATEGGSAWTSTPLPVARSAQSRPT